MLIGYFLFRKKIINEQGCAQFGKILLYIVLPSAIIKSCISTFTKELFICFIYSLIASLIALVVAMMISYLAFKRKYPIENFSASFSNAGFIGIPLIKGVLGDEAVFFVASFIALLNILQWTYGIYVMTGNKERIRVKQIAKNPIVISFIMGIILFIIPFSIPKFITDILSGISSMNAPLAMIILGIYAAQLSKTDMKCDKSIILCTAMRMIIITLLTALFLSICPNLQLDIKIAILIVAAAPVGSNVAIFAQLEGLDYKRAVKTVCLSTVISIITVPLIVCISQYIWV